MERKELLHLQVELSLEKCNFLSGRGNLGEWSGLTAAERFGAPGCLINPALIITEHGFLNSIMFP